MRKPPRRTPLGFTLVELLVVIFIILLVSAVTLPTVLPALQHRQVNEAARILQAAIAGARDAAVRANAPRGIRLMPDPTLTQPPIGNAAGAAPGSISIAYNRIIPIEAAPDYSQGLFTIPFGPYWNNFGVATVPGTRVPGGTGGGVAIPVLVIYQQVTQPVTGIFNNPTSWAWNVRVGDKIVLGESGYQYTIVGPVNQPNPESFVNYGAPGVDPPTNYNDGSPSGITWHPEYLCLVNGRDDNNNGYTDEGFDGLDNDGDTVVDGYGQTLGAVTAINEWENESWFGPEAVGSTISRPYTIKRRPAPTQGTRETTLPQNIVIDATTGLSTQTQERSRLPIDPNSLYVDILLNPSGQVVPNTYYSTPAYFDLAFFHFWLAEREDVKESTSLWGVGGSNPNATATPPQTYTLPMPKGTASYTNGTVLQGERRLVSIFTRTGQVTAGSLENFSVTDVNAPFYQAQLGAREDQ